MDPAQIVAHLSITDVLSVEIQQIRSHEDTRFIDDLLLVHRWLRKGLHVQHVGNHDQCKEQRGVDLQVARLSGVNDHGHQGVPSVEEEERVLDGQDALDSFVFEERRVSVDSVLFLHLVAPVKLDTSDKKVDRGDH